MAPNQSSRQALSSETFVTQAPRIKRANGCEPRRPQSGGIDQSKCTVVKSPTKSKARHRIANVPPADHHAEAQTLKADAEAEDTANTAARPLSGTKRRSSDSDAPDTAESDSDANPPRRRCTVGLSGATRRQIGGSSLDVPTADTSLFSPTITLHGGKSAAEIPVRAMVATRRHRGAKLQPADPPAAASCRSPNSKRLPASKSEATPPPTCQASLGTLTPPAPIVRLPVCSPTRAATRRVLSYARPAPQQQQQQPTARQQSEEAKSETTIAASSHTSEAGWEDENAHSEQDTQIRLPGNSRILHDTMASQSDAESCQMSLHHERLMCLDSGSSLGSDGSDDDFVDDDNTAINELIQQAALRPQGNQTDAQKSMEADFDPFAFIKSLPPLTSVVSSFRDLLLPCKTRASKRKTLVLDLDETLVHSSLDTNHTRPEFTFLVAFGGRTHQVGVQRRPYLDHFLECVSKMFEVVIFTASQKVYAEQLINVLDPRRRLVRHRIFRDSCIVVDGNYLKDLSVLGRDLSQTIIIDNSPQAFGYQLANGIPIESWYDDLNDRELMNLLPFLESLVPVPDVRPAISAAFNLHNRVAHGLESA